MACFRASGAAPATSRAGDAVAPSWRVNLVSVAGGSPVAPSVGPYESRWWLSTSLRFADQHTLVVTWITRVKTPKLAKRGGAGGAMLFHVLLLDSATGVELRRASWPTNVSWARVVFAGGGRFIVQEARELTAFDLHLRPTQRAQLPSGTWMYDTSSSADRILFGGREAGPPPSERRMEVCAQTLRWGEAWSSGPDVQFIGPGGVAGLSLSADPRSYDLLLRLPHGAWRRVATVRGAPIGFISRDWLAFATLYPSSVVFVNISTGEIESRPGGGCGWLRYFPVSSSDGRRVAVPQCATRGRFAMFDISGHSVLSQINIYDGPEYQRSYVLRVGGPAIRDQAKFALSPDGMQAAVLNDSAVEGFQLPTLPPIVPVLRAAPERAQNSRLLPVDSLDALGITQSRATLSSRSHPPMASHSAELVGARWH